MHACTHKHILLLDMHTHIYTDAHMYAHTHTQAHTHTRCTYLYQGRINHKGHWASAQGHQEVGGAQKLEETALAQKLVSLVTKMGEFS